MLTEAGPNLTLRTLIMQGVTLLRTINTALPCSSPARPMVVDPLATVVRAAIQAKHLPRAKSSPKAKLG